VADPRLVVSNVSVFLFVDWLHVPPEARSAYLKVPSTNVTVDVLVDVVVDVLVDVDVLVSLHVSHSAGHDF